MRLTEVGNQIQCFTTLMKKDPVGDASSTRSGLTPPQVEANTEEDLCQQEPDRTLKEWPLKPGHMGGMITTLSKAISNSTVFFISSTLSGLPFGSTVGETASR